ncbi:MAG: hypothetical protein V1720_10885 [bacterium]
MTSNISKIFYLSPFRAFSLIVVFNVICIGGGMGVPVFNILFGFVLGWYLIRWMLVKKFDEKIILARLIRYSFLIALVTAAGMVLIWSAAILINIKSEADIANFGIPLILYEPRASLFGWLILMVVVSPFLQMLTTVFSGVLTLILWWRKTGTAVRSSKETTD